LKREGEVTAVSLLEEEAMLKLLLTVLGDAILRNSGAASNVQDGGLQGRA